MDWVEPVLANRAVALAALVDQVRVSVALADQVSVSVALADQVSVSVSVALADQVSVSAVLADQVLVSAALVDQVLVSAVLADQVLVSAVLADQVLTDFPQYRHRPATQPPPRFEVITTTGIFTIAIGTMVIQLAGLRRAGGLEPRGEHAAGTARQPTVVTPRLSLFTTTTAAT